jgi:hypothetical protein
MTITDIKKDAGLCVMKITFSCILNMAAARATGKKS